MDTRRLQDRQAEALKNDTIEIMTTEKTAESLLTQRQKCKKRFERYFSYLRPEVKQRLKNRIAKAYNTIEQVTKNHHAYDEVGIESDIFLGIIPTVDLMKSLAQEAKKRGKGLTIISIVDMFEFTSGESTLRPKDCQKFGWHHYHLPMTDYTPDMEIDNIIAAAKAIDEAKRRGDVVYIHCKAGKARSAMILAVYFALYDDAFRKTLNDTVLNKPHLLLRSAIQYIKQYRPQVDLHNELIDQFAIDAHALTENTWEQLATHQELLQNQIEKRYSKKDFLGNVHKANIGKLCNAYNAISHEVSLVKNKNVDSATLPTIDYSYHEEHFLNAFVQSAPYKELVIFAWEIQKNSFVEPKRQEYLDRFFQLLIDNPAAAIIDLEQGFLYKDENTYVGRLLQNSKSIEIFDIFERLFVGVRHYQVYHSFEANLIDKVHVAYGNTIKEKLISLLLDKNIIEYLQSQLQQTGLFRQITEWCETNANPEIKECLQLIEEIKSNKTNLNWLLNLDRAFALHQFYESIPGASDALQRASLERIGFPFGVLLSHLHHQDVVDKKIITCLKAIREKCFAGLSTELKLLSDALQKIADLTPHQVKQFAETHPSTITIPPVVSAVTTTLSQIPFASTTDVYNTAIKGP